MKTRYDEIYAKINKMKSLEDKAVLKELIQEVLIQSGEYHQGLMAQLKKEIYEEISVPFSNYNIMTAICHRNEFDPANGIFFSMKTEKELEFPYKNIGELKSALNKEGKVLLGEVFLEADYLILKGLSKSQVFFHGWIRTKENQYRIKVQLLPNTRYINMLRELMEYYVRNHVEDRKANSPYLYKFFDVYLSHVEMTDGERVSLFKKESELNAQSIIEIKYELGEYEKYRKDHMLPLWNVEFLTMAANLFPVPQENDLYYRSDILLDSKQKSCDGFLIGLESGFDGYVSHYSDRIAVFSKDNTLKSWPVIRIHQYKKRLPVNFTYPVMTNRIKDEFVHRYAECYKRYIRTEAELRRKLLSYEVSDAVTYLFYELADEIAIEETYSLLDYSIHEGKGKKYMVLHFAKNCMDFIARDIMSFLVSEASVYFPEYHVVGKLE